MFYSLLAWLSILEYEFSAEIPEISVLRTTSSTGKLEPSVTVKTLVIGILFNRWDS